MPVQKRYQAVIRQFVHLAHERYPHEIKTIILYGSVARGDAGPDSDIDLLVLWKGDDREGWRAMTGIAFDVMVATGESHISQSDGCRHLFRIFRFRTKRDARGDHGCIIGILPLPGRRLVQLEYLLAGGYYNDAVNRAYYAMFYSARALLASRNIHPRGHKGLILQFGLEFVKTGFIEDMYGRMLSHAKERRETADYNIESKITAEEAESIVDDARNFIWRIDKAF